jgi:hypothetical protein
MELNQELTAGNQRGGLGYPPDPVRQGADSFRTASKGHREKQRAGSAERSQRDHARDRRALNSRDHAGTPESWAQETLEPAGPPNPTESPHIR